MIKRLLLALMLLSAPILGSAQVVVFYTDRALGVNPFSPGTNGTPSPIFLSYAQVRVCTIPTTGSPCNTPAPNLTDAFGNPITIVGGNFGQLTTDVVGRWSVGCPPGLYQVQIAATGSNTPASQYPFTCPTGGTGILNNINVWTAQNTFNATTLFPGGIGGTTTANVFNFKVINQTQFADQQTGATADLQINAAEAALPTTGGTVDSRGYGCASQTIANQTPVGSGVGAGSKPVQLLVSPCAAFNITETDAQTVFPISDGSCVVQEGVGGIRSSPFGTFALANGAHVKSIFQPTGFQEFVCIKGPMLVGNPGATVDKGLIYLTSGFINSIFRDISTTACYAPSALAVESGTGGNSDMVFDNDNFDCQGHSTGPVVNMTAQGSQGFGPDMFIGGGIQHAGTGQPLLHIGGNGLTGPVVGMNFWGTQFETITGGGANGIELVDVNHIKFDSIDMTGPGFTDLFHISETVGGATHDISIQNLTSNGIAWTHLVNNTAANANPAQVNGTDLLDYKYKGQVVWANVDFTLGGQFHSTALQGVAPFTIISTTGVANLISMQHPTVRLCGTTTTCAAFANNESAVISAGTVALAGGTATVTGLTYGATSTFNVVANDVTTAANAVKCVPASATSFTCTGTGTDTISYIAAGN